MRLEIFNPKPVKLIAPMTIPAHAQAQAVEAELLAAAIRVSAMAFKLIRFSFFSIQTRMHAIMEKKADLMAE